MAHRYQPATDPRVAPRPATTEIPVAGTRITHDEDGYVTVAWERKQGPTALTIAFSPKTELHGVIIEMLTAISAPTPPGAALDEPSEARGHQFGRGRRH